MKLRHVPSPRTAPALVLAGTIAEATALAAGLGIVAHVRGIRSTGRGCIASCVIVDEAIWPLTDRQLAEVIPCMAGESNPMVYRVQRLRAEDVSSSE